MSDKDFLVALLHLGSALELSLMRQYLYAAYSLGGDGVPLERRPMVQRWRETLLNVAREEMGHLLTVQNLLIFIGATVDISQLDVPWEIEWFELEPLSLDSLACYILAEMPLKRKGVSEDVVQEIRTRAIEHLTHDGTKEIPDLHQVGEVYARIIDLLADTTMIPESMLKPETCLAQASWDEWGRGYRPDPKALDPEGSLIPVPAPPDNLEQYGAIVMVDRVATRTQALNALRALSVQGEGPHGSDKADEPSHFTRFYGIYKEWKDLGPIDWSPTHNVPTNPTTSPKRDNDGSLISGTLSRKWADLFNLRYRILLTYLMHTFRFERVTNPDEPNVRSMLMHRIFGEMYNLKTIARILVGLPLNDKTGTAKRAGPPFEPPFSHNLPLDQADCWKLHLNTLDRADKIAQDLLMKHAGANRAYLAALLDLDRQTTLWIQTILKSLNMAERYPA